MIRVFVFVFFWVTFVVANASVLFVSPAGSDANDGLATSRPKQTIQAAINAAVAGDEIRIQNGTYIENIVVSSGITLRGGYRSNFTKRSPLGYPSIIDDNYKNIGVSVKPLPITQTFTMDGMVVQDSNQGLVAINANVLLTNNSFVNNSGGSTANAAGIDVESDGTRSVNAVITGNLLKNNWSKYQGGGAFVYLDGGKGTFSNNRVLKNGSSVTIGGIFLGFGSFLVENNTIADNTSAGSSAGVMLNGGTFTFRNNQILRNYGSFAAGAYVINCKCDFLGNLVARNVSTGYNCGLAFRSSNGHINNNTFAYNRAEYPAYGPDAIVLFSPNNTPMNPEFANNIVAYNYPAGLAWNYPAVVKPDIHNNCFASNNGVDMWSYDSPGFTNQPLGATDTRRLPLFVDADHDDFRIHPNSPARDTGDDASAMLLTLDLDRQLRKKGSHVDMGAYECGPGGSILFHDTFVTSAPGTQTDRRGENVNFEYNLRQYGSLAPILYTEDPETAGIGPIINDFMSQVNNNGVPTLLLTDWPQSPVGQRPNTSVAIGHDFTSSGDFEVSMELQPVYQQERNPSHWLGFSFGDPARVAWPIISDSRPAGPLLSVGTGVTLQMDGTLTAYDSGILVFQMNAMGDFNPWYQKLPVGFRVHTNGRFDGSGIATWTLLVAGRPVYTYVRPKGYVGNIMTASVYSDPAQQNITSDPTDSAAADLFWDWHVENVDGTPPAVTATPDRSPSASGWYNDDVTWTITATDEVGGSGVREVVTSIDRGVTWTHTIGNKAVVPTLGQFKQYLLFYAIDCAGNKSSVQTKSWWVDESPEPVIVSLSPGPNAAGWNNGNVTATITPVFDALSSQTAYYSVNGGATMTVTAPVLFAGSGQFTLRAWSVDGATNKGPISVQIIKIDRTVPKLSGLAITPTTLTNLGKGQFSPVTVSISASDVGSGVASVNYTVADTLGTCQPSGTLTLGTDGKYHGTISLEAFRTTIQSRYQISFTAIDMASNTSAVTRFAEKVN